MSRTRMFSQIRRAIQQAHFVNQTGWSQVRVGDAIQSRREFLKVSALVALPMAAGVPLSRPISFPSFSRGPSGDRVLILGGGAAGLAAGYTLKKAGVPIRILEASSRVGGRIFTQQKFNAEGQFVELGAEYVDSDHQTLIKLAREVGLEIQDLNEDDFSKLESEVFYFNGVIRYHDDLVEAAGPVAEAIHAAKMEIGPQFNYRTATPAGVKWDHVSLAEFLHSLRGRAEDWILDAIAVGYVLEMGRDPAEQSVCNVFWQIDDNATDGFELFGPSDETRRIKGGNSLLPTRLAELISRHSDDLQTSTRVLALGRHNSKILVTASHDGKTVEYTADQVICTLPLSTLNEIEGIDQIFSAPKIDCIRNIRYGQNTKIMMDFTGRDWRESAGNRKACAGWVMSDLKSQSFWETSRAQNGSHGILTNYLGGTMGFNARRDQIESTTLPDLGRVFPTLPQKYQNGLVMNWNQMPLIKGSYICVGPGQYSRFFGAQMEPEMNGQMLFAGEHTSIEFMGYMNGAYQTGISAAQAIIESRKKKIDLVS